MVDQLAAALHGYVDTAVGVRAEFGSTEADEDPRILALESEVGSLNARLYDLLHERLGLHADLTGMSWGDEDEGDADGLPEPLEVDTFHLGFLVGPPAGTSDLSLDSVLDLVEQGGSELADRLVEAGFVVDGWGASRGGAVRLRRGRGRRGRRRVSDASESTQMQVVRGTPDDVELAALVAGLMAAASDRARHAETAVDAVAAPWADRRRTMRGVRDDALRPGPDAWRWSLRA